MDLMPVMDTSQVMDTSRVMDPAAFLRKEVKTIGDAISEIDGTIATLYVQRAQMLALLDAVVAGIAALHGDLAPNPNIVDSKL